MERRAYSSTAPGSARQFASSAGTGPAPLADFEKVIRVNLVGTFNMIRLAASSMGKLELVDGDRGVIVSTASVAAYEGQIGPPIPLRKGLVAMTLPIARELARISIRVNAIAPGIFMTPMLAGLRQDVQDSLGASRSAVSPRLGAPAEYAALAVHIVENGYINGETIHRRRASDGAR